MPTIYTGEEIIINESSIVTIEVTYPGLDAAVSTLDFTIQDLQQEEGLDFALEAYIYNPISMTSAVESLVSIPVENSNIVFKTAVSYSGLATVFAGGTYEEYTSYIENNNILTLYADKDLLFPFPFVFSIKVSPGEFFTIPDTYAAIYLEGKKDYTINEENLVCTFSIPFASNSNVEIVSDYCLRLCIDIINSSQDSIVTTVWTNIPIGSYLSSGSNNVLLSTDGTLFSKIITLTSNKLYIKGILNGELVYGTNLTDVVINFISSEAIDEYTI